MKEIDDVQRDVKRGHDWEMRMGDCIEEMAAMPNASVDYSVFSPPFSSLYTYSDSPRDLGNCTDDGTFQKHFGFVAAQLARVIKPGRLCSVHCMDLPTSKSMHGYIGLRDFPAELTRAMTAAGFVYHSKVIIWKDPVTAMQRTKALGLLYKQVRKDSSMCRQGIPDEVRTFRNAGENAIRIAHSPSEFPLAEDKVPPGWDKRFNWQNYASPVWMDIDQSDTLQASAARDEKDERHICPLQLEVIRRCIVLWSNKHDLVLSPFGGIASEGHIALQLDRRYVGIELKPSYWKQACKNLAHTENAMNEHTLLR